ncbi:MAG: hypothetical protein K1562_20175, partial [Candidatus Thiodiazotropha sp. (ex. Lucinisca nassula)]|nr:hypothetical protein [Candidatus Thiodiazotropha sp. (ex. Lucinisca nassula)]
GYGLRGIMPFLTDFLRIKLHSTDTMMELTMKHAAAITISTLILLFYVGTSAAMSNAYEQGYDAGYSDGLEDGYIKAYKRSYREGYRDGKDRYYGMHSKRSFDEKEYIRGYKVGYEKGYRKGARKGDRHGYEDGYEQGSIDSLRKKMRKKMRRKNCYDSHLYLGSGRRYKCYN